MSVYTVEVPVALRRPPREHRRLQYVVEAPSGHVAALVAYEWASTRPGVAMALDAIVTEWNEESA